MARSHRDTGSIVRDLFRYTQDAFHSPNTLVYQYVQGFVWFLIFFSIALLVVEVPLANNPVAMKTLVIVDRIVLVLFSLEISLRVITYDPPSLRVFQRPPVGQFRAHLLARVSYLVRPLVLVDIIAVLAFFPELRGLRLLRTLRLLRSSRFFRYRNPFAILLQAFEENGLLFGLAFSVLGAATLLGGMSMYLVEVQYNDGITSAADGLWWALVTITTVGFGDIAPITSVGRIIGAVLMVAGMFTLALFAGIVGSSLVSSVLTIREEQFRMSEHVNHVVVCGYDESTHLMLDALRQELNLSKTRVVLIDVHERPRELPPEFLWVQGDPTKESELGKVRLTHAAAVIVSGERDTTPQVADARTILTTFTIRSYLKQHHKEVAQRRAPLYVVAEILDSENVNHARTAGADEVIETRRIGYSMIAHAVGYHGIATAMSRVLISGSHNIYIGLIPESQVVPTSFGSLLMEMQLSRRGGLVIGIRTPDGQEHINPSKNFRIRPGTQLLYLAEEPLLEAPR